MQCGDFMNISEKQLKKELAAMIDLPIFIATANESKGSTSSEEIIDFLMDNRAVRVEIPNNDTGCEWAFENDVSVSNNIQRLQNTFNNGFDVIIPNSLNKTEEKSAEKAKLLIEERLNILRLQEKIDVMIANRAIYSFSILAKRFNDEDDIIGLLELDCHEDRCKPIRDTRTGDLGGEAGRGLNSEDRAMNVALIQKGKINRYDSNGIFHTDDKNFYFSRDEIIPWTLNDRGKFKTVSPIKRVLRLVEIKKTLENTVALIVIRFGPQIWIIVGNKDYNLSNTRIPESYTRDSNGNPIDVATSRENYRKTIFNTVEKAVNKWSDGESIVQISEYGIEPKIFEPTGNFFPYNRYIDQLADYIKVGIFGLDVAGRVDVNSAVMQDRLFRDLKDRARRERSILENILQNELWNPILKVNGYRENLVLVKFKPLDKIELTEEAETERRRSLAVRQYTDAGFKIPENIMKKWNLEELVSVPEKQLKNPSEKDNLIEQPTPKKGAEK